MIHSTCSGFYMRLLVGAAGVEDARLLWRICTVGIQIEPRGYIYIYTWSTTMELGPQSHNMDVVWYYFGSLWGTSTSDSVQGTLVFTGLSFRCFPAWHADKSNLVCSRLVHKHRYWCNDTFYTHSQPHTQPCRRAMVQFPGSGIGAIVVGTMLFDLLWLQSAIFFSKTPLTSYKCRLAGFPKP